MKYRQGRSMTSILLAAVCLGGNYSTNLELVETTVEQACSELVAMLDEQDVESLSITIDGDHVANWLVEQTAIAILSNRGFSVILSRESASPYVLHIRPMDLAVRYGDTSRSWIFGRKRVERIAVCELSSQLIDLDGAILSSIRSSATDIDQVPVSELDVLDGSEDWTWLGEGEIGGDGGGILEPLVVTGVVASLIYLFYSSRAE
jgi:hypothetical protein